MPNLVQEPPIISQDALPGSGAPPLLLVSSVPTADEVPRFQVRHFIISRNQKRNYN